MKKKSFWQKVFHPDATLPLIAIIIYLALMTVANLLGFYGTMIETPNPTLASMSLIAVLRFAVPAYGLAKLKKWARFTELGLSVLSVLVGIGAIGGGMILLGILNIAFHGFIIHYLTSQDGRRIVSRP